MSKFRGNNCLVRFCIVARTANRSEADREKRLREPMASRQNIISELRRGSEQEVVYHEQFKIGAAQRLRHLSSVGARTNRIMMLNEQGAHWVWLLGGDSAPQAGFVRTRRPVH